MPIIIHQFVFIVNKQKDYQNRNEHLTVKKLERGRSKHTNVVALLDEKAYNI